jgi:E3 ubiquitin-protein ligase SHPRH
MYYINPSSIKIIPRLF